MRIGKVGFNHLTRNTNMINYVKSWLELKVDRRAVTALEYGLIAALIAVAIAATVTTVGTRLNNAFTTISNKLPTT